MLGSRQGTAKRAVLNLHTGSEAGTAVPQRMFIRMPAVNSLRVALVTDSVTALVGAIEPTLLVLLTSLQLVATHR